MTERLATNDVEVVRAPAAGLDVLAALETPQFTDMIAETAQGFGAAYGALVLVDDDSLWFCSRFGFAEPVTARDGSFWDAAMAAGGPFVVDLVSDPRFTAEGHVIGGVPVRSWVSCVFRAPDRRPIGLFCFAHPEFLEVDAAKQGLMTGVVSFIETELVASAELERAAAVQRALLPKRVPPLDGYEVAGACLPAKFVGGDFFDWFAIDGGLAFTLADIMGKGVGAGIIAATVRATVRTARHEDVAVAADRAAEALAKDLRGAASFVTLFHARLTAADGSISYVDAGHGLTLLLAADGTTRRLSSTDIPLGLTLGVPSPPLRQHRVILEKGGTLVSFSDGVLDLFDGTIDGVDRVAEIARGAASAHEVVAEIERLARGRPRWDDVTVIVIRRTSEAAT